jgi:membrane protein YdbS with pleckstrin-like domain
MSGHRQAETLPEEILEYTTERRSLSPRVRILWSVRAGAVAILFGIIAGLFATNAGASPAITGVLVLVFLFVGLGLVLARYRVWIYQIRRDALYLERGVFQHVRTLVPFVRIQHVDTSRGPLERALGLSTLVVYTAGSRGADVSVPGLTPEEARDLQQRVKELAIQAEGGDAV